jgi:hypothetical protein
MRNEERKMRKAKKGSSYFSLFSLLFSLLLRSLTLSRVGFLLGFIKPSGGITRRHFFISKLPPHKRGELLK